MTYESLLAVLLENPSASIQLILPDGSIVPAHFHITEVGNVQKDFIDCGGTVRSTAACVMQAWVAHDEEHRLDTTKLARILRLAAPLMKSLEVPVEVEYETSVVSQYPLADVEVTPSMVLLRLGTKHTACLAADRCGVAEANAACCASPGCCT